MDEVKKIRYMSEREYADYVRGKKCQDYRWIIKYLKENWLFSLYTKRWSIRDWKTCENIFNDYKYKEKIWEDSNVLFFVY